MHADREIENPGPEGEKILGLSWPRCTSPVGTPASVPSDQAR